MDEYFSLDADLRHGGHYVAAQALEDASEAATVRMAIEFAKRLPAVRHGAVEVRPVMTLPGRDD